MIRYRILVRGWFPQPAIAALISVAIAWPAFTAAPRAEGGVRLIEAMESAPLTVVARVSESRRLDSIGRSALLEVETALRGDSKAGSMLRIAWEELAASRDPRFLDGDRLLVSLEPLSGASIWLGRYPDASVRGRVMGVAMRGDAFLRNPSLGTVDRLQHYLAQGREARAGEPGAAVLVDLALGADVRLATDAVRHLAGRSQLDAMLGPSGARRLVSVLLRGDVTPQLEDTVIDLIGSAPLASARSALVSLTQRKPRPPASVFAALAALDGELSPEQTAKLLDDAPARYRAIAVRNASGDTSASMLARLSRSDPDAGVRAAALERLSVLEGEAAIELLARGLGDPERPVRRMAMHRLAALGEPALPTLLRVIDGNDREAARAALASLSLVHSDAAHAALVEVADTHSDKGLRALAGIALGRRLGDAH